MQKEICRKSHITVHEACQCQSNDEAEELIREFNMVRSNIFNFHSVRSIKIVTKSSEKYQFVNIR